MVGHYTFLGSSTSSFGTYIREAYKNKSIARFYITTPSDDGNKMRADFPGLPGGISGYSDRRMKDIIGENLDAMDKINRIKVYDFTFKKDDLKTPHVGVIAQELQKVFPNAVTKDENGYLQIRHEDMFFTMINALKELDAKIKQIALQLADNIKIVASDSEKIRDLTIRVNNQDKEIKALKKEIADLRKVISKLK